MVNFSGIGWISQVFAAVFAVLVSDYMVRRLLKRLQNKARETATFWDDAVLDAGSKPVSGLIWLFGLAFAADIARRQTASALLDLVDPVRRVGLILLIAWFLVRLIKRVETNFARRCTGQARGVDRTTLTALSNLGRVSVLITAALVVLESMGYSISGILAFGGIGGVVIGFAAKDLLANLFGSLMVYLDRPFQIGDWIRSPDRAIEGTVEHIGWRTTRIMTFEQRPIYVPNAMFTTITLENPSRMTNRRINETIGLRLTDLHAMEAITSDVREMLGAHDGIDQVRTPMVYFDTISDQALKFFVYCFTKTTDWNAYQAIKHDVLLHIGRIIEANGAALALPATALYMTPAAARSVQLPSA